MLTPKLTTTFFLTLIICAPLSAQDYTIEPARGIGKIKLGSPRQAVHQVLGKPTRTFRTHNRLMADSWSNNKTGNELEVVFQADKAIQIKVSSSSFSTPEGASTSKSLAQIQGLYPSLKKTTYFFDEENGRGLDYFDDIKRGIAFVFFSPTSEPPESQKPWVIVVHTSGKQAIPVEIKDPKNKVE